MPTPVTILSMILKALVYTSSFEHASLLINTHLNSSVMHIPKEIKAVIIEYKRKRRKGFMLSKPTQLPIHMQWWSMRATHRLHWLQWWDRGGFTLWQCSHRFRNFWRISSTSLTSSERIDPTSIISSPVSSEKATMLWNLDPVPLLLAAELFLNTWSCRLFFVLTKIEPKLF